MCSRLDKDARLQGWLRTTAAFTLLKRLARQDAAIAALLVTQAEAVLRRLPVHGGTTRLVAALRSCVVRLGYFRPSTALLQSLTLRRALHLAMTELTVPFMPIIQRTLIPITRPVRVSICNKRPLSSVIKTQAPHHRTRNRASVGQWMRANSRPER